MGNKVDLERVSAEAVRMTSRLIRDLGEDKALLVLRVFRDEIERAIGECNFVVGSRTVFAQQCEREVVPAPVKKFVPRVIQGGAA